MCRLVNLKDKSNENGGRIRRLKTGPGGAQSECQRHQRPKGKLAPLREVAESPSMAARQYTGKRRNRGKRKFKQDRRSSMESVQGKFTSDFNPGEGGKYEKTDSPGKGRRRRAQPTGTASLLLGKGRLSTNRSRKCHRLRVYRNPKTKNTVRRARPPSLLSRYGRWSGAIRSTLRWPGREPSESPPKGENLTKALASCFERHIHGGIRTGRSHKTGPIAWWIITRLSKIGATLRHRQGGPREEARM